MTAQDRTTLTLADGRTLDLRMAGPQGAPVLVHFHGTPQSGAMDRVTLAAALDQGLRVVSWSRPGYASSAPLPGRTVASVAADTREVLDALGVERALVAGWSGGGPHALAAAALLPERVRAVAVLAGVAPYAESQGSLDFLAGMGQDNVEEFGAALLGEPALRAYLAPHVDALAGVQREEVVAAMASLLPPSDVAWIEGDYGLDLAAGFREALGSGAEGWVEDDLAFVAPWGFELGDLDVPVAIWQGGEDLMVPSAHGEWLAAHVPGATPRLLAGEGHLSVVLGRAGQIVAELVEAGG